MDANRLIDLSLGIYYRIIFNFFPTTSQHITSSLSQLEILIVAVSEAKVKESTLPQSAWAFQKCDCGRTDNVCERALAPSIPPLQLVLQDLTRKSLS